MLKYWLIVFITINSCSYYLYDTSLEVGIKAFPQNLTGIEYFLISTNEDNLGYNIAATIAAAIKTDSSYRTISSPRDYPASRVGIIEFRLLEARYWEIDSKDFVAGGQVDSLNLNLPVNSASSVTGAAPLISNAKINLQFSIKSLANKLIYATNKPVSFQQIYLTKREIESRPDGEIEVERLIKLAVDRILFDISKVKQKEYIYFERGISENALRRLFDPLSGDITITKGIRFAKDYNFDYAVTAWLKAAFEPETTDNKYFTINRASAYYNMAQVYYYNEIWDKAALYAAYANLVNRKTLYAQTWADALTQKNTMLQTPPVLNLELIELSKKIKPPKAVPGFDAPNFEYLLKEQFLFQNEQK